ACTLQRLGEPSAAFGKVTVKMPEPLNRRGDLDCLLVIRALQRPTQGGAYVVMLGFESSQPGFLIGRVVAGFGLLSELLVEGCVLLTQPFGLAALFELLAGVFADGFQHDEARLVGL